MTATAFRMKSDAAIDHIRHLIMSGQAPPGTRITTRAIAQALGISDTPVREAIRALVAAEWLVLRPHIGAVVAGVDVTAAREIYGIRASLGALAVELGAPSYDAARLADLDAVLRAGESALTDPDVFAALDQRLHTLLSDTPSTIMINRILSGLWPRAESMRRERGVPDGRLREAHAEHIAIRDAIVIGDHARAALLVRAHELASLAALSRDDPIP